MFLKKNNYNFKTLNSINYTYTNIFFTMTKSEINRIYNKNYTIIDNFLKNSECWNEIKKIKKDKIIDLKTKNQKYEKIVYEYITNYILKYKYSITQIEKTENGKELITNILYFCEKYLNQSNNKEMKLFGI